MGRSRPWPDALFALTGEREMDATAVLEYLAPFVGWLEAPVIVTASEAEAKAAPRAHPGRAPAVASIGATGQDRTRGCHSSHAMTDIERWRRERVTRHHLGHGSCRCHKG
jgi:hypothetical protein